MEKSISVKIAPQDSRCKFWAKLIGKDQALPLPSECDSASAIPGGFLRLGEEELADGEFLILGEQVHHRKMRGWEYKIVWMNANGTKSSLVPHTETKARLKAAGLPIELLKGSGELAACARVILAHRLGILADSIISV